MKHDELKEGLADLAQRVEQDHEVQMAKSDLYKSAKYSIKLHELLKNVSEEKGLEGWVAAKITKASDYLSSVFHYMEYEMMDETKEAVSESMACDCDKNCACGGNCTPNCNCHPGCGPSTKEDYKQTLQNRLSEQLKKKTEPVLEDFVGKSITEEQFEKLAEKKDACYHKVKARYKVWPSAYASGALVQCRKKGAANWGKSKKK